HVTADKQRGRPFEHGTSGNPSGRPKNARNQTAVDLFKVGGASEEVICFVIDAIRRTNGRVNCCATTFKECFFVMPGYNHYSWCMCGWCYKTGSSWYSRKEPTGEIDYVSAQRTIADAGANRSYSACFVVPNASCPECGASVYYYQNEH